MQRGIYDEAHEDFRDMARRFIAKEVVPHFHEWERAGAPPKEFYSRAGELGILGVQIPEEFGGGGQSSFKFNAVLTEESFRACVGLGSMRVHMDIVLPYVLHFASDAQKRRWLPGMASGELMTAIAMTEPGTGSDLAGINTHARREGDTFVIDGSKTFITGGRNAGLVFVVARTAPADESNRRTGLSIIAVETGTPGFSVGRTLEKLGAKAQDTTELTFDNVVVPADNLLGEEGAGFGYLAHNLAQERLAIGIGAQASARAALAVTLEYVTGRNVFGKPVSSFQNSKFVLAECATDIEAGQALCDRAIEELDGGRLTPVDAAKVKLFCTEMQSRVVDKCLQLHGGYGYMLEYPISRLFADARVTRIYGGTSEVLKSLISKSLDI
ncbi:acyl-CoA dehydrogenase family protein [Mycobacterium kyogaense]|uniref:acyl-CoA dehydrogenase family protein n=1 Tax=Mycobacterium kyogaense TaxID=2212479 RepID=UPI000DAEF79A|nr:acyl-CoA dehydrogenase family protein [Mycobacterium kyogaense]